MAEPEEVIDEDKYCFVWVNWKHLDPRGMVACRMRVQRWDRSTSQWGNGAGCPCRRHGWLCSRGIGIEGSGRSESGGSGWRRWRR